MIIKTRDTLIDTTRGPMRTVIMEPVTPGKYPSVILFSEIFQLTGPVLRLGSMIAGHGYIVALPEIYHEFEVPGCVLGYTTEGADRGNALKTTKELSSYDEDVDRMCAYVKTLPNANGRIGSFGVCIGGHLAFRAALHPDVSAAACMYATDLHKRSLGKGQQDDTLARIGELDAELLLVWGRQDPHVSDEGREFLYRTLRESGKTFSWHEFNGQHAFMRDEGARFDPQLAQTCFSLTFDLFRRTLST